MAVNTTGVTPAANFLPNVWAPEVSDATQANTVLPDLIDRHFEDSLKFGNNFVIPDRSNPAVRMKSQDTTATWANRTETNQNFAINRQAYVAFLVEDIAEIQSKYDVRSEYTDAAGYSLAAFVEGDATSGMASLLDDPTNAVGTLGVDPADDDLILAKTYLDRADVPATDRYMYVSPGYHNGLLKIDKFVRSGDYDTGGSVKKGKVGQVYNAPVYISTLCANNPNVSGQAYGLMGHKRGIVLVQQRKPTIHTQYIILEVGWGVLVDTIYQFILRNIAPKTLGGGTSNDQFSVSLKGPS